MSYTSSFARGFIERLSKQHQYGELPRFDVSDASDRDLLVSRSTPQSFELGTGASIFTNTLIPAITAAQSEVIFVTCFWAPSKTLSALNDALTKLAAHRCRSGLVSPPLTVRICFSSRSLFQKLLHPQSRDGYVYPPSSWQKDLGLPDPALLQGANIDLQVKSLFFLPFSVMHPKFVIIDRRRAFVPSCNVSWEAWLEGCVEVTGDAVNSLMAFYSRTWDASLDFRKTLEPPPEGSHLFDARLSDLSVIASSARYHTPLLHLSSPLPTFILPSSHHRNPRFRPFPWQKAPKPPGTPLNVALLEQFDQAQRCIYMQTPNLTAEPVITALLEVLERGVDVTIVTSRNMMLFEQLVTAGTTTSWCIRSLMRRYNRLKRRPRFPDPEMNRSELGRLRISYFHSRMLSSTPGPTESDAEEPVHSHLKLTVIDDEHTILGSGNMDRASWFTSQELGILFHDGHFAQEIMTAVRSVLDGRLDLVFDSDN